MKKLGVEVKVTSYNQYDKLKSLLTHILKKPKIALNFGEKILSSDRTVYADQIRLGDYFSIKEFV